MMISELVYQFERAKHKRQMKREGDEHQYEDYFLTDEQIANQEQLQLWSGALVAVCGAYALTVEECADAFVAAAQVGYDISDEA